MNNFDPYDNGTPKYSTASGIYDAICELVQTEEEGILTEMFPDVSYEGQRYYYTDNGARLKEELDHATDWCESMWPLDLAIVQLDGAEVHDIVFESLRDPDLAKRIGFKKLFVDIMLRGDSSHYGDITDNCFEKLLDMDCFNSVEMSRAFALAIRGSCHETMPYTDYAALTCALSEKVLKLNLQKEKQLIIECRALLTSYDDFLFGLRGNQALHEGLERRYAEKCAELETLYEEMISRLIDEAARQGLAINFDALKMLPEEK